MEEQKNKKKTAAFCQYQADCGGELDEIHFI